MTAIVACWDRSRKTHASGRVAAMAETLGMYGRDRSARWSEDEVGMAIRQRYTVPEDAFDVQPTLLDGVVLVADVRLDDRDALVRALECEPERAATMADSLLLHVAWRRWGVDCVRHLVGEFAFALWDSRQRVFFCARDPVGARPLCYAIRGETIAVASMPKGLLALPEIPRRLDERRMAEYLSLLPSDGARTFFDGISLLSPGHTLYATAERIRCEPYWEIPDAGSLRYANDDDYVEHFLEVYARAVSARLRVRGPLAALVSGGYDSTSVTALAARQLGARGETLHALTWIPRPGAEAPAVGAGQLPDESRHAASLATRYPNIQHGVVESGDECPLAALPEFHEAWDEPLLNPIKVPMLRATAARLAALGCDTVLMGQFGNMSVSYDGLTLLPTLVRQGRWLRAARETVALGRAPGWNSRRAVSAAVSPVLPPGMFRVLRRLRDGAPASPVVHTAVHADFAASHRVASLAAQRGWTIQGAPPSDARHLRPQLLRRLDMSMAMKGLLAVLGVDHRDPTWDVRLLTYCWSIPEDQFLRAGQSRWLFRRAMADVLPPMILQETRRGLQSADWPRFLAPYRDIYVKQVDRIDRSPLARRIIDVSALRRLLDRWPDRWKPADRFPYGILLLRTIGAGEFIRRFDTNA